MSEYPTIVWVPEDVMSLRPDWNYLEASYWLENNRKHIVDRSIEYGWTVIEALLPTLGDQP